MTTVIHLNILGKASGTQNVSLEIAQSTPAYKHIFVFSSEVDPEFLMHIEHLGFEVKINPHLVRNINIVSDLRSLIWLIKFHNQVNFDILHSHSSKANFISRLFKVFRKSVSVINHIHGLPFTTSRSRLVNSIYYLIEAVSSWKADRIVLVNHLYKSYWPYRHGKTLYNFSETNKSIFKRSFERGEKLSVGFVGRFDRQKNPERFIRIAKLLKQEDITFHMWGEPMVDGRGQDPIEGVEINNWVTPTEEGEINIDVLLIVSRWEAFSMVALEAAKRNILVLGIPVDGFSEIVRTIGLPIEIDSDEAVARVLVWLSSLEDESLHILKKVCSVRSSLLEELSELSTNNLYERTEKYVG